MASAVRLREVTDDDLSAFYRQQLDPAANHMAAFTAEDPTDQDAFAAHWTEIRGDDTVIIKTIVFEGTLVGHIAKFERAGEAEVTYWIARPYWGRGLATEALVRFLGHVTKRPLYARAAQDNVASLRVLEKCGFAISSQGRGFASAPGQEIDEVVLKLDAAP